MLAIFARIWDCPPDVGKTGNGNSLKNSSHATPNLPAAIPGTQFLRKVWHLEFTTFAGILVGLIVWRSCASHHRSYEFMNMMAMSCLQRVIHGPPQHLLPFFSWKHWLFSKSFWTESPFLAAGTIRSFSFRRTVYQQQHLWASSHERHN